MNSIVTLLKHATRRQDGAWNFGWIPPDERTAAQAAAHREAVAKMPKFQIFGRTDYKEGKAFLFDLWSHPTTAAALSFEYPGTHQLTGSCVGAGGGNALFTLIAGDAITRGEPEQIVVPFWLLPYGRSRLYMGENFPGQGSFGSTFAQAVREDGVLDASQEGLPAFKNKDGLIWGEEIEMSWSDGDAQQTLDLLEHSREHPVKTTAECPSADDVRDALANGYPCTCASTWGGHGLDGRECDVKGDPPALLNIRCDSWGHQMSVQAWWDHPALKELYWIHNQWGLKIHGECPSGAPAGGFWITKAEMEWICRNGEVYAFSGFNGFPAQNVEWDWRGRL